MLRPFLKALILFIIMLIAANQAKSQFSLSGEFRTRAEARNGYGELIKEGQNTAFLISQRTRVNILYQKDWLKTGLSFQDVRVWGDELIFNSTGIFGDNASIDLNEAWAELNFLKNSSLKIGRQYFDYDDSRLLSARNWNNHSVKYDAVRYRYQNMNLSVDAAFSLNNMADNRYGNQYISTKMKTLYFVRIQQKLNQKLSISAIALGSGFMQSDTTESMNTRVSLGTYISYQTDRLKSWTSYYHQLGKNNMGTKVNAWNLNARADYKTGKLTPGIGFSLISGDNSNSADSDNLFDLLYGVRHASYGYMDYFNNMPKATKNGGLNDLYGVVAFEASKKLTLTAEYHYFALNSKVLNTHPEISGTYLASPLGSEIDLWFMIRFSEQVAVNGGYSVMIPEKSMEVIQQINPGKASVSSWGWLQLTIKPTFFKAN